MLHHRYEAERRPLTHIVQSIHNDLAASLSKFGVPEEEMAKAYHDMSYSVLRRELKESLLERLQAKHRALCAMRAAKRLVGPAFGDGVVGVRVMAVCSGAVTTVNPHMLACRSASPSMCHWWQTMLTPNSMRLGWQVECCSHWSSTAPWPMMPWHW